MDQQNSALLRVTAQAVKAEGITVKHVETPRLTVSYVVVEVLEPEEPGPVIVNIIAAIFGIISAGACAALVRSSLDTASQGETGHLGGHF